MSAIDLYGRPSKDYEARLAETQAVLIRAAAELYPITQASSLGAEDVVAFGDMPNDIEMLRWAGHGYAMASGHPDAIRAAAHTAPHFDDDGVAQILEARLADLGVRQP